ncbi:MAG: hypothetical protein ACRC2T_11185 [Thermoguttaceae bacterium]
MTHILESNNTFFTAAVDGTIFDRKRRYFLANLVNTTPAVLRFLPEFEKYSSGGGAGTVEAEPNIARPRLLKIQTL